MQIIALLAGFACASDFSEREADLNLEMLEEIPEVYHHLEKRDAYQDTSSNTGTSNTFNKNAGQAATLPDFNPADFTPGTYAYNFAKYGNIGGPISYSKFRSEFFRKFGYYPTLNSYYGYDGYTAAKFFKRFGYMSGKSIFNRFGHLTPTQFYTRYGFYPPFGYNSRYSFLYKFW